MNNMLLIESRFPNVAFKISELKEKRLDTDSIYQESVGYDEEWMRAVEGSVGGIKLIFVYGLSQGIGLADVIEKYPDNLIVVYEPDEASFWHSLNHYDLTPVLEWPKLLWLSVGESQLDMIFYNICTYMDRELAFVTLRQYLYTSYDALKDVKDKFLKYQVTFESNRLTMNFFGKDWVRNPLNQLATTVQHPSIIDLNVPFKGSTAVVVASGPSLSGDIEWLKKLKDHALIISAGSNIQALVSHGIQPHLTTILDGSPINEKVFSQPGALEAPLLFSLSAYYGISDMKQKDMLYGVFHNDLISQYGLDLNENYPYIYATPTVSGTAIQAAVALGAKRIIFMGQDLSFQNGKYYADGVEHADKNTLNNEVQNATLKVKNVIGGENDTTTAFKLMKDSLESVIAVFSDVEFINATRGGAHIEGATWIPPEKAYELIQEESVPVNGVLDVLRSVQDQLVERSVGQAELLKSRLNFLSYDLLEVKNELFSIRKKMNKIQEMARFKPQKAWDNLASIEVVWRNIVNRPWFEAVFLTLNPRSIHDFDRLLPLLSLERDILKKSDMIYEHLGNLVKLMIEEIPEIIEMITESISRINQAERGELL